MEFKNGSTASVKYTYDKNGNLTQDLNKGIRKIAYNSRNLPERIEFTNTKMIHYTYDAAGTKRRVVHQNGSDTPMKQYCENKVYDGTTLTMIMHETGYLTKENGTWKYFYYLKDHVGSNRVVLDDPGGVVQINNFYPYGLTQAEQPYKFGGKELDRDFGVDAYDFEARMYNPAIGRFMQPDPLAEKYYSISPYAYCLNNPLKYVDPTGKDVWVKRLENGTYEVVGGTANTDLNIYIVDGDGNRTNDIVGQTMTGYSFHDDKGKSINGAIINPNDQSGQDFINSEIITDNPNILYYIPNATGGEKYDFKSRGDVRGVDNTKNHYRGMPLKDADGNIVYGSARDVGNYGAGYVAGKSGLNWSTARMGFDALESYQNGKLSTEGKPTQRAERLGYDAGSKQYPLRKASNWIKQLFK